MRPDVAAFRELDTLVRNLTEQLAGYRRRALAGEARARELEQRVHELEAALAAARAEATAVASLSVGVGYADPGPATGDEVALRARLVEARERTSILADRVRFLRQQLTHGTDR